MEESYFYLLFKSELTWFYPLKWVLFFLPLKQYLRYLEQWPNTGYKQPQSLPAIKDNWEYQYVSDCLDHEPNEGEGLDRRRGQVLCLVRLVLLVHHDARGHDTQESIVHLIKVL